MGRSLDVRLFEERLVARLEPTVLAVMTLAVTVADRSLRRVGTRQGDA